MTADRLKFNYVEQPTQKSNVISVLPRSQSKTDDPSSKMEHHGKLKASPDPPQIAHFTAHVCDFTEALRSGGRNVECSWLLRPLRALPPSLPFVQHRDKHY